MKATQLYEWIMGGVKYAEIKGVAMWVLFIGSLLTDDWLWWRE